MTKDAVRLYGLSTPADISKMAIGSDSDIGGLSRCHLNSERETLPDGRSFAYARFYGTISPQVPRGAALERSGYAAFRNKQRPTLFGSETWDMSFYPFLALRVRNRTPPPPPPLDGGSSAAHSSLRAALYANDSAGHAVPRAVQALGLPNPGEAAPPAPMHPLFFVNIQTDGPVTTDLFQHRLPLDPAKGDAWQTVTIPLDSFVLTNMGVVADSQISMMREKISTVGISVLLEPPQLPDEEESAQETAEPRTDSVPQDSAAAPNALRRHVDAETGADGGRPGRGGAKAVASSATSRGTPPPPVRGGMRQRALSFDLGVESVWMVPRPEQVEVLFG
ncbi:hypothetical protein MSPP1_000089 [Malassezia sp. CBS 17886]|nr:hypothetical protein MSPP1_000089 [Malassezia sp. CBS 17886]